MGEGARALRGTARCAIDETQSPERGEAKRSSCHRASRDARLSTGYGKLTAARRCGPAALVQIAPFSGLKFLRAHPNPTCATWVQFSRFCGMGHESDQLVRGF